MALPVKIVATADLKHILVCMLVKINKLKKIHDKNKYWNFGMLRPMTKEEKNFCIGLWNKTASSSLLSSELKVYYLALSSTKNN